MSDFPVGPFFNLRTKDEFSWLKRCVWKIFGKKRVGSGSGVVVTAYYLMGITYISKFEVIDE